METSDERYLAKKISYSEPNLEVTVGSGDTQKVYMYHAFVMATLSSYIDRMLSSPMKEGHTKQITFPEIEPSKWEAMMRYLEPGKRETPDVDEAKELAKWYDKYDFQSGLSMCDLVVRDFLTSENEEILGAKRDAYVVAYNHNLVFSQGAGTVLFAELLQDPASRRSLTITDISTLAPLIGRVDSLWAAVKNIIPTIKHQVNRELLVQETCFPMLLHQVIQKEDRGLIVKNAGLDVVNGNYIRNGTVNGAHRYSKKGVWTGKEGFFVLYRNTIIAFNNASNAIIAFNNASKTTSWMLTFYAIDGEPPMNSFYSAPESLKSLGGYPPGQGWCLSMSQLGVTPSPTVTLN
jgi:hypothetical protein